MGCNFPEFQMKNIQHCLEQDDCGSARLVQPNVTAVVHHTLGLLLTKKASLRIYDEKVIILMI